MRSYLECSLLDYVIFNYGFHGPRKQIWDHVLQNLSDLNYQLLPITITCGEEENRARMVKDGRDTARIERALAVRSLYDGLDCPIIDTTGLTVEDTVNKVLEIVMDYETSQKQ